MLFCSYLAYSYAYDICIEHHVWDCDYVVCVCFVFQAEDGIRDLVRSRGLGDVYKRQDLLPEQNRGKFLGIRMIFWIAIPMVIGPWIGSTPVSYTHLTLPTSDLV